MITLGNRIPTKEHYDIPSEEYVVRTIQILGKRRSGKSYCASKIAEDLLTDHIPIVIIDPMNAYWGLKEKFDIIIMGKHGDTGIDVSISSLEEPKAVKELATNLANHVAESDASIIINLSSFKNRYKQLFTNHFLDTLFIANKIRRHVFIEEADIFAPQKPSNPMQFECLDSVDNVVRRGGQKGLGVTIITQRPQLVSKNILSQADLSLIFNVQAPQDLKAIMDIMSDSNFSRAETNLQRDSIKGQRPGICIAYSPEWLKTGREQIEVAKKLTYHAGETLGQSSKSKKEFIVKRSEELKSIVAKLFESKPQPVIELDMSKAIHIDQPNARVQTRLLYDSKEGIHKQCQQKIKDLEQDNVLLQQELKDERMHVEAIHKQCQEHTAIMLTDQELLKTIREVILGLFPELEQQGIIPFLEQDPIIRLDKDKYTQVFSDQDIEGQLLWIILNESLFFTEDQTIVDVHKWIQKRFQIPASEHIGKPNAARFRAKLLKALTMFSKRPFDYLVLNQSGYTLKAGFNPERITQVDKQLEAETT